MIPHGPIGIFDSGFGGLSIYQSIVSLLPNESTVYIGDHAYLPYGSKTRTQIRSRAKKLISFLLARGAKLIVVACNTATVAGIDDYRAWFPNVPIIGVVPVVKTAAEKSKKGEFAVLSTPFTTASRYQKHLIATFAPRAHVYAIGCPNLLDFVEQGVLDGPAVEHELRSILTPQVCSSVDVIALGCTHYPFLEPTIRAIVGGAVQILDSSGAVARHVERILRHNTSLAKDGLVSHEFYSTEGERSSVASRLLGYTVSVAYAHI